MIPSKEHDVLTCGDITSEVPNIVAGVDRVNDGNQTLVLNLEFEHQRQPVRFRSSDRVITHSKRRGSTIGIKTLQLFFEIVMERVRACPPHVLLVRETHTVSACQILLTFPKLLNFQEKLLLNHRVSKERPRRTPVDEISRAPHGRASKAGVTETGFRLRTNHDRNIFPGKQNSFNVHFFLLPGIPGSGPCVARIPCQNTSVKTRIQYYQHSTMSIQILRIQFLPSKTIRALGSVTSRHKNLKSLFPPHKAIFRCHEPLFTNQRRKLLPGFLPRQLVMHSLKSMLVSVSSPHLVAKPNSRTDNCLHGILRF